MGLHGVHCVIHNIEEHLHQLISVAAYTGKHGLQLEFNFCTGIAEVKRAQLHSICHHRVEIKQSALGGHLSSKAQEIANKSFGAAGLVADFRRYRPGFFRKRCIVGQKIGIAEDRGKGIIDFMRSASGELAKRHELFGLHELGLQPLQTFNGLLGAGQ